MTQCYLCGKTVETPFTCKNCGFDYCDQHHLMWNHPCKTPKLKPKQFPKILFVAIIVGVLVVSGTLFVLSQTPSQPQTIQNPPQVTAPTSPTQNSKIDDSDLNKNTNSYQPKSIMISNPSSCSVSVGYGFAKFECGYQSMVTLQSIKRQCQTEHISENVTYQSCTYSTLPVWLNGNYTINPINIVTKNGIEYIEFNTPSGKYVEHILDQTEGNSFINNAFASFENSIKNLDESTYYRTNQNTMISQNPASESNQQNESSSDGSTLQNYALQLINDDRAMNDLPPVKLSTNKAAQVQADDILKNRVLSHWMSDGEKPYMSYSKYGGMGAVAQNVAYSGYMDASQCNDPLIICTKIDPVEEIKNAQWGMMYNDSSSNWGHKENILDKHHTDVSIGLAYDEYYFVIVQNFENNYIDYSLPLTETNGVVSFSGTLKTGTLDNVEIFYDPLPSTLLYEIHKNDNFYKMGDRLGIIQPPPSEGTYYVPSNQTYELSNNWTELGNHISVSFNISPFVTKPGVYTAVAVVNDSRDLFEATTFSITKLSPMIADGAVSPLLYNACSPVQLEEFDQLSIQIDNFKTQLDPMKQKYDTLSAQYESRPKTATSDQEYQEDMQMYNQLETMRGQINGLVDTINALQHQINNYRC